MARAPQSEEIKDIAKKIDGIVPFKLAQGWDNVGLLIGEADRDVKNILLTRRAIASLNICLNRK